MSDSATAPELLEGALCKATFLLFKTLAPPVAETSAFAFGKMNAVPLTSLHRNDMHLLGASLQGAALLVSLFASLAGALTLAKISQVYRGDESSLDAYDEFGRAVARMGDINGDHFPDIAVGAPFDDDGGRDRGAVWIVLLKGDRQAATVSGDLSPYRKISSLRGGLQGPLRDGDHFGWCITLLGDVDGDSLPDIAVGAPSDRQHPGAPPKGAVYVMMLREDSTVKAEQKLGENRGGFVGQLQARAMFGASVAGIGDLDGDGTPDVAVGVPGDNGAGSNQGAVWVVFLTRDGSVRRQYKISKRPDRLPGTLNDGDAFGYASAAIGDVNGDGVVDLAVGAPYDHGGGFQRGAVHILFLQPTGQVLRQQKIGADTGGAAFSLADGDQFGASVSAYGDMNADGVVDIFVGAPARDDLSRGLRDRGSIFAVHLKWDGTAVGHVELHDTHFGTAVSHSFDHFGSSIALVGELDNANSFPELAVGAALRSPTSTTTSAGSVLVAQMQSPGRPTSTSNVAELTANAGGLFITGSQSWGTAVAVVGKLNDDDVPDVAVGQAQYSSHRGRVWLLFLRADGTVLKRTVLQSGENGMPTIGAYERFGESLSSCGDINGDKVPDLLVGAPRTASHADRRGAIWVLILRRDGQVATYRTLTYATTGFPSASVLSAYAACGSSLAVLDESGADGWMHIATGCINHPTARGSALVLRLSSRGILKEPEDYNFLPAATDSPFTGLIGTSEQFGRSIAAPGDINNDGFNDLAVGVDYTYATEGRVWLLFLDAQAALMSWKELSAANAPEWSSVDIATPFQWVVPVSAGDVNGDGIPDLLLGHPRASITQSGDGAVALAMLNRDGSFQSYTRFDATHTLLRNVLGPDSEFGTAAALLADVDGDGLGELLIGAPKDNEAGTDHGALYLVSLGKLLDVGAPASTLAHERFHTCRKGFNSTKVGYWAL